MGGLVEAVGEGVGLCAAFAGVAGPAGGGVPSGAVAGGVDVDADEDNILLTQEETSRIYTPYTLCQRYIIIFRHQELCIIATIHEICHDSLCYLTIVESFTKLPIRTSFSCGHQTMTIVDKDFHSSSSLRWNKIKIGQKQKKI